MTWFHRTIASFPHVLPTCILWLLTWPDNQTVRTFWNRATLIFETMPQYFERTKEDPEITGRHVNENHCLHYTLSSIIKSILVQNIYNSRGPKSWCPWKKTPMSFPHWQAIAYASCKEYSWNLLKHIQIKGNAMLKLLVNWFVGVLMPCQLLWRVTSWNTIKEVFKVCIEQKLKNDPRLT